MALAKLKFQPGVDKEGTQYSDGTGWFDSDKVRFRSGRPEKIGGWQKYIDSTFLGTCRSLFNWANTSFTDYLGFGTTLKYYINEGNSYYDITPIRKITNPMANDPFTTGAAGSRLVTVTDTTHGAVVGDFVTFDDAAGFDGIPAGDLNKEHRVIQILTANTYVIEVDTPCTVGGIAGGGAVVEAYYQINIGLDVYVPSTGWGVGPWGGGPWGSTNPITPSNQLRLWNQDNYGNDLIINVRGGGIFYWDESSGTSTRAVALSAVSGASDAPVNAVQIMVSESSGQVIAFGCNPIGSTAIDPLFVRWSASDTAVDWTPTSTNDAGGQILGAGSFIIGAIKTKQEILIFTDAGIYSMRYVGSPFVYSFSLVTGQYSVIAPNAAAEANGVVFFMDHGGFYVYNGAVQTLPCSVLDYVFSDINLGQAYKIFAGANSDFSEVTWYYPSSDSMEIDRYVTFNYKENLWTIGTMPRFAWLESQIKNFPIASGRDNGNNYLYRHETGYDADGLPLVAYIESGGVELDQNGQRFMYVSRIIPDFKFKGSTSSNMVNIVIKGKDYPLQSAVTKSTSVIGDTTDQVFIRNRMREAIVRIESDGLGYGWRLGDIRLDMRSDGQR
jgi:hypothetical protein